MQLNYNIIFDLSYVLFKPDDSRTGAGVRYFSPIQQGIELLHAVAAQATESGQKRHRLYVLSNMDDQSLNHLMDDYPHIFSLFAGIVVSGKSAFKKPDPRIFKHLIAQYSLVPHDSIFIDDSPENVAAARSCGMFGIECAHYPAVEQELKILGAL